MVPGHLSMCAPAGGRRLGREGGPPGETLVVRITLVGKGGWLYSNMYVGVLRGNITSVVRVLN